MSSRAEEDIYRTATWKMCLRGMCGINKSTSELCSGVAIGKRAMLTKV